MLFLNYCIFSGSAESLLRCGGEIIASVDCLLFR